jgi:mannose-P-dolichol utilization defect protein 1
MNISESKLIELCSILYPKECCHQIIDDFEFETECLKTIISKSLGYGIIMGSTIVKLPQVIKIVNGKSAQGINFVGVLMELMAMTFAAAYSLSNGFPFSAWGESLFLMIVTASIGFFILYYDSKKSFSLLFTIIYLTISYVLMSGLTPINILWSLQAINLPLIIFGKLIQALTNYKNGHTGQLSAITVWLLFLGAVVRIFTSIRETGDKLVILNFGCASFANFILVAQVMLYWNKTNDFIKTPTKNKI